MVGHQRELLLVLSQHTRLACLRDWLHLSHLLLWSTIILTYHDNLVNQIFLTHAILEFTVLYV